MVIAPYDLGNNQVLEDCQSINIDTLVAAAHKRFKMSLLEANIEALGVSIMLTTTKTNFKGERFWFTCPSCQRRVRIVYKNPLTETIGCRNCLRLLYRQQRYRGKIESVV